MVPTRLRIGDVDRMVEAALADARAGHNVYVEARTVGEHVRGKARGSDADTRAVFAFVVDADADKGMAGSVAAKPSLVVETSPGNRHLWFFLDRALTLDEAKPVGQAIRARTGTDHDTGVTGQPYRVAGTPNFPSSPRKLASGRSIAPTRILSTDGPIWTRTALLDAFPLPEPARTADPSGQSERRFGATASLSCVEPLVAEVATPAMDRSARFQTAVHSARWHGLSIDDLETLMRKHPRGCAAKYLEKRDRLRAELERSWAKPYRRRDEAPCAPAYPDNRKPVDDARRAVEEAIAAHFAAAASRGGG